MTETTAILIPPGDFRTNMERRSTVIDIGPTKKEPEPTKVVPAWTILAAHLTGYDTGLPVDPLKAMSDVPVDRPDLLGHRWKEGRCVNAWCPARLTNVPSDLTGEARDRFLVGESVSRRQRVRVMARSMWPQLPEMEYRCNGETPPAFVPRVVSWCPVCLAPFEGKTCGCGG